MSYASAILADGPLGYWKLTEANGSGTVADSSGNGYSGTVDSGVTLGSAALLPNDPGTSASFAGSSVKLVRIPTVGSALNDTNGQSIEWWARIDGLPSLNAGDFDFLSITTAGDEFGRYHGDGLAYPGQFMAARLNAFAVIPSSGLHHFVVTRKTGGSFIWYMDGAVLASTATPNALAAPSTLLIGGNANPAAALAFFGKIGHVSLWNKELTAAQVSAHYQAAFSGAGYASVIGAATPTAWWRLDDTGATAVDQMGAHNGTLHGGITTGVAGALASDSDTAMTFDGVNGFIDSSTGLGTYNAWTVEAWVKPNGVQPYGAAILTDTYPPAVGYCLFFQVAGTLTIRGGFYDTAIGGWQYSPTSTLTDQVWSHCLTTYDGSNLALYVNGALIGKTAVTDAGLSSGTGFRIGRRWDNFPPDSFKGSIDEVAFYNYAFTAAQVKTHYDAAFIGIPVKGPTRIGGVNEGSSRATGQGPNFASIDNPGANRVGG